MRRGIWESDIYWEQLLKNALETKGPPHSAVHYQQSTSDDLRRGLRSRQKEMALSEQFLPKASWTWQSLHFCGFFPASVHVSELRSQDAGSWIHWHKNNRGLPSQLSASRRSLCWGPVHILALWNRTTWQPASESERETPKVSWFLMKNIVGFGFRLLKFYSDVVGICHLVSIPGSQNLGSNIQPPPESPCCRKSQLFPLILKLGHISTRPKLLAKLTPLIIIRDEHGTYTGPISLKPQDFCGIAGEESHTSSVNMNQKANGTAYKWSFTLSGW